MTKDRVPPAQGIGSVRILRAGRPVDAISPDDRGLNYGDGLFETILVHEGRPVWWNAHWKRLDLGAGRLEIPMPDEASVLSGIASMVAGERRAALKLLLSRGPGGRGYLPPERPEPALVLSLHKAPEPVAGPVDLRWCEIRLAIQPALAGLKHLNRLENVLARAEWRDPAIFEGLMLDTEGRVACATAANVFARIDGRWRTPRVDRRGIAGIARDWLLAHLAAVDEADFGIEELMRAEALFLCNSLRGIMPVRRLGTRVWPDDEDIARLRQRLAEAESAFAIPVC